MHINNNFKYEGEYYVLSDLTVHLKTNPYSTFIITKE